MKGKIMHKILSLALLFPTVFMLCTGIANAQRKNTTSHDIPAPIEISVTENLNENCNCDCNKHQKHHKKHHKSHKNSKEKTSQN